MPKSNNSEHAKQRQAILDLLRGGPATTKALHAVAYQYNARIHELRNSGYVVECKKQNGTHIYTLKSEPKGESSRCLSCPSTPEKWDIKDGRAYCHICGVFKGYLRR